MALIYPHKHTELIVTNRFWTYDGWIGKRFSNYHVNCLRADQTDTQRDYPFGLCSWDNLDTQCETSFKVYAGVSCSLPILYIGFTVFFLSISSLSVSSALFPFTWKWRGWQLSPYKKNHGNNSSTVDTLTLILLKNRVLLETSHNTYTEVAVHIFHRILQIIIPDHTTHSFKREFFCFDTDVIKCECTCIYT